MTRLEENVDYELIPGEGENWDIRVLTGPFVETVLNFSKLKVAEDGEHLTFSFDVVSSPEEGLNPDENIDLQKCAADILYAILENSVTVKNKE